MASIVLLSWPIVALVLYFRLGPLRGLIWTFLIGYLFLPEALSFDLPGLPPYQKRTAIGVSCLIGLLLARQRKIGIYDVAGQLNYRAAGTVFKFLMLILFLSPVATVMLNQDPIRFTEYSLPSLGFRDYVSIAVSFILLLLPFMAARALLFEEEGQRELLMAVVTVGLIYSVMVLFERRMSPLIHTWVYGYFQHQWAQHVRGGGFRPVVFMQHGLHLGFFLFVVTIGAFALFRDKFLSHRGLVFVPLMLFGGRKIQLWFMVAVSCLMIVLPGLQQNKLIPLNTAVEIAGKISPERAYSLQYRIDNEQAILERASERPMFGWGTWARWRIYDENGRDLSTVDGLWISIFGEYGWVGYLTYFSLLSLPLLFLLLASRKRRIPSVTIGIGLIMTGNLIYMIPNAAGSPLSWLMAGAFKAAILQAQSWKGRRDLSARFEKENSSTR